MVLDTLIWLHYHDLHEFSPVFHRFQIDGRKLASMNQCNLLLDMALEDIEKSRKLLDKITELQTVRALELNETKALLAEQIAAESMPHRLLF